MSTHYLIDAHTIPVADSDINEVRYNATSSPLMGNFVVRVADDKPLDEEPSTLASLLTKKYAAVLAYYSTYTNIVYEDFTDSPGVDMTNSRGAHSGVRCTSKVSHMDAALPAAAFLQTSATVLGAAPAACVVTWELFRVITTNPKDGRLTREYEEVDPSEVVVEVSFNNGSTWTSANDGGLVSIAGGDQGTDLVLKFNAVSPTDSFWLGSWSVLF